jgi:hypothetical protein
MPDLGELRGLSEEELIEKHDALFKDAERATHHVIDRQLFLARARIYADELARRDAEAQGTRMESLTRSMNRLSVVAVVATIAGVILTALSLIFG